jgi:hypothetical protein
MSYEYKEIDKCPVVIIDDVFDSAETKDIWRTINSISVEGLMEPRNTGSASNGSGIPAKQNSGVFLTSLYDEAHAGMCPLNRVMIPKLSTITMTEEELSTNSKDVKLPGFSKDHPVFREYFFAESLTVLLSYYEEDDHYLAHYDKSNLTALCWFCKDEAAFEGGNLIIGVNDKETIQFKNNRVVIIPGWAQHEVTPITINEGYKTEDGDGRWCVSIFYA